MNRVLHTAKRRQPVRPVPASSQGHEATHVSEVYGGENLPVLIRLPDLSSATILPLPKVAELACDAEVISGDAAPSAEPPRAQQPTGPASQPLLRRQRDLRSQRLSSKREAAGWLHGLGQLAMAAVLAGILLVIVITIKNWNAENAAAVPAAGAPFTASPQLEFSGPLLESVDDLQPVQGPELGSPSMSRQSDQLESGSSEAPALPTFSAVRSAAGGPSGSTPVYGNSGDRSLSSPSAGVVNYAEHYPTTGAQPLSASPQIPGAGPDRGWSETISVGRERSAAWPPADANNLRR